MAADTSVRICHWTEKEHAKHVRADFPYFAAVWTTEASPDEFRTICDFSNWVGLWQWPPMKLQANGRRRFLILTIVSTLPCTLYDNGDRALLMHWSSIRRWRTQRASGKRKERNPSTDRAHEVAESYHIFSRAVSTSTCLSECVAAHHKGNFTLHTPITTCFVPKRKLWC